MPRDLGSCAELAARLRIDPTRLRQMLGLRSIRSRVAGWDIHTALSYGSSDFDDIALPLARISCPEADDYVELDWWDEYDSPYFRLRKPPRIFATGRPFDRDAESDARELIKLLKLDVEQESDIALIRAATAAALAATTMRSVERDVLLMRLSGKRGGPKSTWDWIMRELSLRSVKFAKEVFKVAVAEFMSKYAYYSDELLQHPDFQDDE